MSLLRSVKEKESRKKKLQVIHFEIIFMNAGLILMIILYAAF